MDDAERHHHNGVQLVLQGKTKGSSPKFPPARSASISSADTPLLEMQTKRPEAQVHLP